MWFGIDIGGTYTDVVEFENFRHVMHLKTEKVMENPEILKKFDKCVIGIASWVRDNKILKAPNIKNVNKFFESFKLENDANCFAVYVKHLVKENNIIAITLGTGVGAGLILDGKLYRGRGLAGEIGHVFVGDDEKCVCNNSGHLECHFSGWKIKRDFGREARREELLNYKGFKTLCIEISRAIMLLDVDVVAIGGRLGKIFKREDFFQIYEYLPSEFRPEIVIIDDELAVAKGASILAREMYD